MADAAAPSVVVAWTRHLQRYASEPGAWVDASEAIGPQPASDRQTMARRIAALHAAGNLDSAAAELREFRRAFPDADRFLPDDLLAWAAGVPGPDAP